MHINITTCTHYLHIYMYMYTYISIFFLYIYVCACAWVCACIYAFCFLPKILVSAINSLIMILSSKTARKTILAQLFQRLWKIRRLIKVESLENNRKCKYIDIFHVLQADWLEVYWCNVVFLPLIYLHQPRFLQNKHFDKRQSRAV